MVKQKYDIVICGGGMAGLTLARHLSMELPRLSVVVVERTPRPLPEAGFKVGESSVEGGSHYIGQVLGLHAYLKEKHLLKNGLRFFPGGSHLPLDQRPEMGPPSLPLVPGYQIDRGVFENDVREMVRNDGVDLLEGYVVDDFELKPGSLHQISIRNTESGEQHSLQCRWLVDAAGRRHLLRSKLKLASPWPHKLNAAWFRYEGRLDINDLVPQGQWHSRRDPLNKRYMSTNHLMGHGYWVWFIPLGSGNTSVGIVAEEQHHPIRDHNSYELALEWLRKHEPVVAGYLEGRQPLDFKCYKDCSFGSFQTFSADRWACVGEAGVFLDPLYSVGLDFIALSNCITVEMITRDMEDRLSTDNAAAFNKLYLALANNVVQLYAGAYHIFNRADVLQAKLYWDLGFYWGLMAPISFFELYKKPDLLCRLEFVQKTLALNLRMQQLFKDWARMPSSIQVEGFTRYPPLFSFLSRSHLELWRNKSQKQALRDIEKNCRMLEDAARVWFIRAVKGVLPAEAAAVEASKTLNPYAISLDPSQWQREGLFTGMPSDAALMDRDIRYYCREFEQSWSDLARHLLRFYMWNNRIPAPETAALSNAAFDHINFSGRANSFFDWWASFMSIQRALAQAE